MAGATANEKASASRLAVKRMTRGNLDLTRMAAHLYG
jgi:hypothetical protein